MGYSEDPSHVRVDFFKATGKWSATEAISFIGWLGDIHSAFIKSLAHRLVQPDGTLRYAGMWAVCLEPYSQHSYPLMKKVPDCWEEVFPGVPVPAADSSEK